MDICAKNVPAGAWPVFLTCLLSHWGLACRDEITFDQVHACCSHSCLASFANPSQRKGKRIKDSVCCGEDIYLLFVCIFLMICSLFLSVLMYKISVQNIIFPFTFLCLLFCYLKIFVSTSTWYPKHAGWISKKVGGRLTFMFVRGAF